MKYKVSNVCQLIDKSKYPATTTFDGITFTNNGDGSWTLNGTNTRDYEYIHYVIYRFNSIKPYHKYMLIGGKIGGQWSGSKIQLMLNVILNDGSKKFYNVDSFTSFITLGDFKSVDYSLIELRVYKNYTLDYTFKPQLFDLTEMYGAGNEPTTVEEFRKDFPDEYYEYSPKCFEVIHKLHYVNESGKYLTMNRGKFVTETNNLLHIKDYEDTINGVTVTIKNDLITLNGTSTSFAAFYPKFTKISTSNNCTLSVNEISGSIQQTNWLQRYYIVIYSKSLSYPAKNITGIIPNSTTTSFQLSFEKDTCFINYTFKIQIEEGSTATDYKPHKHIAFN